jgi:hypothetical protein
LLLQEYEKGRHSEEDKAQELQRNRRLVEQMLKSSKAQVGKLPELTKTEEQLFERIEVLMMHKQPLFKVTQSTERRNPPYVHEEVPRARIVVEKLCSCCGNIVKKHCCPHSLCQKPCKVEEKRLRMRVQQQQNRGTDENNPHEP